MNYLIVWALIVLLSCINVVICNNNVPTVSTSTIINTVAGSTRPGFNDSTTGGNYALFSQPNAISYDPTVNVAYLSDYNNNVIREITLPNIASATSLIQESSSATTIPNIMVPNPTANCLDYTSDSAYRYLYVASGKTLQQIALHPKMAATINVLTIQGDQFNQSITDCAVTNIQTSICIGKDCNVNKYQVYVVNQMYVYVLNPTSTNTFQSTALTQLASSLPSPISITLDSTTGNVYIISGNTIIGISNSIDDTTTKDNLIVLGGKNTADNWNTTDGGNANSRFNQPVCIRIDSTNTQLYIIEQAGNYVRMMDISNGFSSTNTITIAGNLTQSNMLQYNDGNGDMASFSKLSGLAFIPNTIANILFLSDSGLNNAIRSIINLPPPNVDNENLDAAGPLIAYIVGSITGLLLIFSVLSWLCKWGIFAPEKKGILLDDVGN